MLDLTGSNRASVPAPNLRIGDEIVDHKVCRHCHISA
jgi:hypothetical protein